MSVLGWRRFGGLLAAGTAVAATLIGAPAAEAGPRCNVTHWHQHFVEDHGHYHDWYYEYSYDNHGTLMRAYRLSQHGNRRHTIACGSSSGAEGAMTQQVTWNSIDAKDTYQEVGLVYDVLNLFQS